MDNSTWRIGLPPDSRQKIVKRIMDTLQRHMPPAGQENMGELLKIACRFEEKIFQAAVDQQDYLRKISLKMLSLETKAQATPGNGMQGRLVNGQGVKSLDPGPPVLMQNQAQSLGNGVQLPGQVSGPGQQRQQLSLQNHLNANVMQNPTGMGASLPNINGLSQTPLSTNSGQNMMLNSQRIPMQRQQQQQQTQQSQQQQPQQQASVHQQHLIYQQRMQHQQQQQQQQLLKQKQLQQQSLIQQQQSLQQQVGPLQQQQPATQMLSQTGNVQSTLQQQQLMQVQLLQQQKQQQQQAQQQQQLLQQQQVQQQQVQQQQPTVLLAQSQQSQQPQQPNPSQLAQQPQQLQQLQSSSQQLAQQGQQQRLQQAGALSQQQPIIYDIQHQNQRVFPESSTASIDSSGHSGAQGLDHREVVWPKLQVLKDKYLQDMKELYGMLTTRSTMPMPPEQLQKLKHYKDVLHRMIPYLTVPKEKVPREFNQDKVEAFEKQIVSIMETFKRRRQTPAQQPNLQPPQQMQPGQVPQPQQQQQQIFSQIQQQDTKHGQQMQLSGSGQQSVGALHPNNPSSMPQNAGSALQQSGLPNLQQSSLPSLQPSGLPSLQQSGLPSLQQSGLSSLQQSVVNSAQPHATALQASTVNQLQNGVQGNGVNTMQNGMSSLQQSTVNPLQQNVANSLQSHGLGPLQPSGPGTHQPNVVNNLQQASGVSTLQQQSGNNSLQPNGVNSLLQPGTATSQQNGTLQQQQQQLLHVQQQQRLLKEQEQAKQHLAQQQLQQQQLLQQQQQQQQQLLQQQQKIQAPTLHPHQHVPHGQQLSEYSGTEALKAKQTAATKHVLLQQQQQLKQRQLFQHQQHQLKVGSPQLNSQLVSSPQILQAPSPQISISQQLSPQTDHQNFVAPLQVPKVGTPLQAATPPLRTPSPSMLPVASPPLHDDVDVKSATPSIATPGSAQALQTATPNNMNGTGTPGPSVSPMMVDFTQSPVAVGVPQDVAQAFSPGTPIVDKTNVDPVDRLISKVDSISAKALSSSVGEMNAIISCHDKLGASAPGIGSRAAVGEDLALVTKARLQARSWMSQDCSNPVKKKLRRMDSVPLCLVSSDGSVVNSLHRAEGFDPLETGSMVMSTLKSPRFKVPLYIREEIRQINNSLIDTEVEVSEEGTEEAAAQGKEGVVVTCNYKCVSVSPNFNQNKTLCLPRVWLLIPPSYPESSPIFLPEYMPPNASFPVASAAREQFVREVRCLTSPVSLKATAFVWDKCAHSALSEAATLHGGGTFSTNIGVWERYVTA